MREGTVPNLKNDYPELARLLRGEEPIKIDGECWTGPLEADLGMREGRPYRPNIR